MVRLGDHRSPSQGYCDTIPDLERLPQNKWTRQRAGGVLDNHKRSGKYILDEVSSVITDVEMSMVSTGDNEGS